MNLILFSPQETDRPLPRSDARARHLLEILRRRSGDIFDAGLINGPRGKGTITAITADSLQLRFTWEAAPPLEDDITLIIGLARPQTARKILREATSLGVSALHFVLTEKGEASYAQSTLWSTGEWEKHLRSGAEQAFCTRLPTVTHGRTLTAALATLPASAIRVALDNYESPIAFSACNASRDLAAVVALGPERGWSAAERELLRGSGFAFAHLGARVLRIETAVVAAVVLLRAKRGTM